MSSFGPPLPGGRASSSSDEEAEHRRPAPVRSIGESTSMHRVDDRESSDEDCYGPALPPGLSAASSSSNVIGPLLPSHLMQKSEEQESSGEESDGEQEQHQQAAAGLDDTESQPADTESSFGPLPPSATDCAVDDGDSVRRRFEAHAEKMRRKLDPQEEELKREEWMTALPDKKKSIGLGLTNRSFKAVSSYVEDEDRSGWTDTPADRERRKAEGKDEDKKKKKKSNADVVPESVRQRNAELQRQTEEYNKLHRGESLMSLHQQKRKADREAGIVAKKPMLQPFDPDRDMQPEVSMSASSRQKVIASASRLNNRFQRSNFE